MGRAPLTSWAQEQPQISITEITDNAFGRDVFGFSGAQYIPFDPHGPVAGPSSGPPASAAATDGGASVRGPAYMVMPSTTTANEAFESAISASMGLSMTEVQPAMAAFDLFATIPFQNDPFLADLMSGQLG